MSRVSVHQGFDRITSQSSVSQGALPECLKRCVLTKILNYRRKKSARARRTKYPPVSTSASACVSRLSHSHDESPSGLSHLVIKFFTEALCLSVLGEYSDLVAHIKVNRLSFAFGIFNHLFLSSGHRLLSLISSFLHSLGCLHCLVVTHPLADVCRLRCVSVKGCPCRVVINELEQWHFNTTMGEGHLREVHHWQEFWPVILIVLNKELKALIQVLIHDLCLAICLQMESSEEL